MFGALSLFDDDDFFKSDRRKSDKNRRVDPFHSSMQEMMGFFRGDPFMNNMMEMMPNDNYNREGGGFSSSSTMVMSSQMGPDGNMHTERFSKSSVQDFDRDAREVQQAYSNSHNGVDKMSLERQYKDRGRKMVKEYDHQRGEEQQHQMFRGMEEDEADGFDEIWLEEVSPYLPRHSSNQNSARQQLPGRAQFANGAITAGGARNRRGRRQEALEY